MTPTQPSQAVEYRTLYEITGKLGDANTLLVPRAELARPQGVAAPVGEGEVEAVLVDFCRVTKGAARSRDRMRYALERFVASRVPVALPQEVAAVGVSDAEVLSALMLVGDGPYGTSDHADMRKVLENFASQRVPVALPAEPFQSRVQPWMMACFGPAISANVIERNHRFLEESLELVQSTGCTQSEAHQLVDYVYGRPAGETPQEVGGVMVTLAALCLAHPGLDMHACGEVELARIWTCVEKIRAKQAAKPAHSPLPIATPAPKQGEARPINCGTGHCSCIECLYPPKQGDAKDARPDSFHSDSGDRDRVQARGPADKAFVKLRFFRDLSQDQRLSMFRTFADLDDVAASEVTNHAGETLLFNYIWLSPWREKFVRAIDAAILASKATAAGEGES